MLGWSEYNTERPHQSLGMRPPIERFQLAPANPAGGVDVIDPVPVQVVDPGVRAEPRRLPGVQRWVDRHGLISLAGFRYRVPIVLAGEPVEAVVAEHLVRIFHRDVLVAEHVQRRKPDTEPKQPVQGRRTARTATSGMTVTRIADNSGTVSFAGTNVSGRERVAAAECAGLHRRRVGPAGLRRADRPGPSDPARPDQGTRGVRHPERAAPAPPGCAGRGRRQGHAAARSAWRPSLDPHPLTRRDSPGRGTTHHHKGSERVSRRYRNSLVKRVPELDSPHLVRI